MESNSSGMAALAEQREVPVKVTAWVDEGIASLVVALNDLDGVVTLDSCQGGAGRPASVFFCLRGGHAAVFADALAGRLAPCEAVADYTLTAEWRAGIGEPRFRLACPTAQVSVLAQALRASG